MIPNWHSKEPIPLKIPKEMEEKIKEFKKAGNKKEFVKKSFNYLTKKYRIDRISFVIKFFDLYKKDLNFLWNKKGFIYCTSINYLLRIMLVKSDFFRDNDVELTSSHTWYFMPHQYLRVRISKKEFWNVDPWAFNLGIPFGSFAHGFNAGTIFPKN